MPPPRRLVTGTFEALEPALIGAIRAARAAGSPLDPIPVLAPSNPLRAHLTRTLAATGGSLNVRFYLAPDLARALLPGLREAPPHLDDLVLEGALAEPAAGGGPFAALRDRPGLRAALLGAFRELGEAGIDPADLARAVRALDRGGGEGARVSELARLYGAYREAMAATGCLEAWELVRRASLAVARSPLLDRAPAAFVYGFHELSQVQLGLVEALADRLATSVFMPWREGRSHAWARPCLERLRERGFLAEPAPPAAGEQPAALRALKARLFEDAAGPAAEPDGSVAILSAPGEAREAREIARRVAALFRRLPGLGQERVAVLVRSAPQYRRVIDLALREVGLVTAVPRPLADTRGGRTLLALLEARRSHLGRREVMDLLDLARPGEAAREPWPVARWERLSREARVVGGLADWERRLSSLAGDPRHGNGGAAARRLLALVRSLALRLDRLPERGAPGRFAAVLADLVRWLVQEGGEREALLEALWRLGRLDLARRDVSLERFAELVRASLEEVARPVAPGEPRPGVRGVAVLDLKSARGVPFDVVAVPGLADRLFPAAGRPSPLLPDRLRRELAEWLGRPGVLRRDGERMAEEELLFGLACASARRRLVLSYPRLDPASGRGRAPSPFLEAVRRALGGGGGQGRGAGSAERVPPGRWWPSDPREAESELEYDLATGELEDPREVLHLALASPVFARGLELDHARRSPELGPHDGVVGPGPSLAVERTTATRLETWARCPFSYLLRHGLGLEPCEEPERAPVMDARERGKLVHAILYEFLTHRRQAGRFLDPDRREALLADLLRVAEGAFARHQERGLVPPGLVWELERRAMVEDLECWLDGELRDARVEPWRPGYFELRFGPASTRADAAVAPEDPASSDRPLRLDVGAGPPLELGGRIDRIDLAERGGRFRVTDYKTGRPQDLSPEQLRGGRSLQLPIYLLAARMLLGDAGLEPASGEARYFYVTRRGGFRSVRYTEVDWVRKRDALYRALGIIRDGIARGVFEPEPDDRECRRCDFLRVCGPGRERSAELKAGDPVRRPWCDLRSLE